MRRIFLPLLITLFVAQARDLHPDLAAMRQRLQSHSVVRPKLSPLHHRAALVSSTLAETSAALERSDGQNLGYLRERLLTASRNLEADFAAIEARLAGLGLPEKTAAWHEFVQHYRTRLAEVDAELASLAATAGGLSREELRARLAALRVKFGPAREAPVQETVSGRLYVAQAVPPASGSSPAQPPFADDLPTPGDLAESKVVLLTAEIRALAQVLGRRPTALNDWVATHTEYVPYLGQMQNSLAVLWSHHGNAFDQATLLIALLRASGFPARYVYADVVMSRADVKDWMGVKDPAILLGLLSRGLGFSLFPVIEPERVVASHVWVEAYLDTSIGKGWFAMDPARKRRTYQPGIVLPRPPYDRMAYLRALKPGLPSEPYLDAMRADLQKTYPGRGFNEVPYIGSLLPPTPPMPQQPYPVVKLHFRAAEVPANLRHRPSLRRPRRRRAADRELASGAGAVLSGGPFFACGHERPADRAPAGYSSRATARSSPGR